MGPPACSCCRLPESYAVWMGHILSPEEVKVRLCTVHKRMCGVICSGMRCLLRRTGVRVVATA